MNIKFYEKESKIYDFLNFPCVYEIKSIIDGESIENDLLDGKNQDSYKEYLDIINYLTKKLEDYMEILEKLYLRKIVNDFNLVDLIILSNPILGYVDIDDYFEKLMSIESEDFVFNIIKKINCFWDEDELENNNKDLHSYLNSYDIDDSSKWLLLNIGMDSKKIISEWKSFLYEFEGEFEKIYGEMEDLVLLTGRNLEDKMAGGEETTIEDLTSGLIRTEIFNQDSINLLVSIIFPYEISLISMTAKLEKPYISWGLYMEESFEIMKKEEENRLDTRVEIFKNLGDRTRYELLIALIEGKKSNKEIAKDLGVSGATISYHINSFVNSKIIKINKKDSKYGYDINKDIIIDAIDGLKKDLIL